MRRAAGLSFVLVLTACATGGRTQFSGAGLGPIPPVVECARNAIADEGFTVVQSDEAGILRAERGADRVEMNVRGDGAGRFVIDVTTTNSALARDAAGDIISQCAR